MVDGSSVGAVNAYSFYNVTADHTVSATFSVNANAYTISASAGEGGSISPLSANVNYGGSQTFAIIPNSGYLVADVIVDGIDQGAVTSYTFNNVTADHTISATFAVNTNAYTIAASAGSGGTISPSGTVLLNPGASQAFTITPNTGYAVIDVLVDGSSVGAVSAYSFYNVTADHTISATFAANTNTYTIAASAGEGGSILPSGTVSVNQGSDQTFSFNPAAGYQVSSVLVDGAPLPATLPPESGCTFANVDANHTLVVSFAPITSTAVSYGFSTLDYPGAAATYACGINDSGQATGYYYDSSWNVHGFVYSGGSFTTLDNPGAVQTLPAGINNNGQETGYYLDSSYNWHGFVYSGGSFTTLDYPGAAQTSPTGIGNNGQVTGYYLDSSNNSHGFVYSSGSFTTIDYPGANGTYSNGINNNGLITGYYVVDSSGYSSLITGYHVDISRLSSLYYGFVYSNGIFITLNYPSATWATVNSINDGSQATGYYTDTSGNSHSFMYGAGVSATIAYPGAVYTYAYGINNSGQVTGNYTDSSYNTHGFVASPPQMITANAGPGGSISPSGTVAVNSGANQTFTISPNTGYQVADVLVDGVNQGAITSYTFSNVTATHTISATFATAGYTITATAGSNGSISPSGPVSVNSGANQTFTMSPNTGYQVADVQVDGADQGAITSYTFSNVTEVHTISATFAINTYTVTPSAGANGSISPSTAQTVNYDGTTTFTVTPNTGYTTGSVTGCGGTLSGNTYTTGQVTGNCSVAAAFAIDTYTVTPSAGANGSISPSTPQSVNYDGTTSFTMTPNTGYNISSVTGCGGTLSGSTYTTGQITGNCSVSAAFAIDTYTVTPSAGANGSISPSTPQTVNYDGTKTFTLTPNTGYNISSVTGCGGTLSGSTYTTGQVTGNCSVTAAFAINTYTITPSAGTGGSISPSAAQTVNYDGTTTFTVTPNTGYNISSVTGCGGTLSGNTYTTGQVTGNCSVSAAFTTGSYTVIPSAGTGGAISPSTAQTVNYDGTTSFTVTPNTGYNISSVTGCGGTLSGNTYTTGQVTGNCSVSAVFALNTYTVTPSAGTGGSISPSTAQTVNYDGTTTFTVTPNTGYSIGSVTGCGGTLSGSTYTTGPVTANCSVSAAFPINTYTVTPSAGAGGSISPTTPQTVNYDGTTSFTVTPNTGYNIFSVTGCGGTLSGNTYTTGQVTGNCSVLAAFAINTYTITPSAGTGGSISPSAAQTVNYDGTTTFTVTPNTGYNISSVSGCGGTLSGNTYTTGQVTGNCSVSAAFTTGSYTVTPSAGTGGAISPSTAQTVNYDGTTSFTVTPNTGYNISSVSGCGGTLSGNTYTTGQVTGNCSVSTAFAIDTFTVTPSAGTGGSISPSTAQTVNYDGTTTFTVTPNTGFSIGSVTGCGGTLSGGTYTTGPVTANCSVSAAFPINTYTVTPSAGAGGSISPTSPQTVNYDGTTSFTVTPNTGFSIGSVTGCGGTLSGSTYTTGPITGNCSVTATFPITTYTVTPSAGAGGSISPSTPQTVNYDGTTSFTVTPNSGYSISR